MAEIRQISKDTILFYEGDMPDNMYVVQSGTFEIIKKVDGAPVIINEAKAGQLIGEMALFDLRPRSATIRAAEDGMVVVLPYVNLLDQMDKLPEWVKVVMRTLAENLRKTTEQLMNKK